MQRAGKIMDYKQGLCLVVLLFSSWSAALHANEPTPYESKLVEANGSANINVTSEPVLPIPLHVNVDQRKVALGLRLFEDKKLSKDGSMSCRSCHLLDKGGADGEVLSPSIDGKLRSTNTPSIFNLEFSTLYGWMGLPRTLSGLSEAIIKSKKGLANDWPAILPYLKADADYLHQFKTIYPDGISANNVKDAMAEYMRSLITPNSRFDRFLRGEELVLTKEEFGGYQLFKSYGCASCHQGELLGGNMFASNNIFREHFVKKGEKVKLDIGRYTKTKDENDRYVFRVPSLRNIALTSPYFHDGSADNLLEAVDLMGKYMLGRKIPEEHQVLIVKFLHTLTGELAGEPL